MPIRSPQRPGLAAQTSSESAFALRYRGSARAALLVETREGDVVQLKIRTSGSLGLDASGFAAGDRLVQGVQLAGRSRTQINLVVNGDLNAKELAAIQNVVDQAAGIAGDFFDSDLQSAFRNAVELRIDGQQLAAVGLKLRMKEQLTYSQQSIRGARSVQPAGT